MISGKEVLFGKIALREGLISTLQLNDALAMQEFSGSIRPLGAILREQGVLTDDQVAHLLAVQRSLARSTDGRERLDDCRGLLFGTIAVAHKFCTETQLHDALRIQEIVERQLPLSVGEIMLKRQYLTSDQVWQVLKLQNRAVYLCQQCDVVFNYPCQDLDDDDSADGSSGSGSGDSQRGGDTPAPVCLRCGGPLVEGARTISRHGSAVEVASSSSVRGRANAGASASSSGRLAGRTASASGRRSLVSESDIADPPAAPVAPAAMIASPPARSTGPRVSPPPSPSARRPIYALGANDLADAMRAAGQTSARQSATESGENDMPRAERLARAKLDALPDERPVEPPMTDRPPVARRQSSANWRRSVQSMATVRIIDAEAPTLAKPVTPAGVPPPPPRQDEADVVHGRRLGNYIVQREIGRGGMGVVYEARHVDHPTARFAIKFIRKDLSRNEVYLRRFQREIALVLSLNHANIVETFETGVKDGFHYLVMEYVQGENLGDVLEREGRLPVRRAVEITRQTALALSFAHRQGIVHRDMKPDNVILATGGPPTANSPGGEVVKITDFGLAKDLAGLDDALTLTGQLIGTPHYMSPEQCRGEYSDQRSDIYSLGCTFYHLLTGRPPFIGDNYLSVMEQQKHEPTTPPHQISPAVPVSISFIVGKMMEKNPDNRYPTLDLLLQHLEMWDSDQLADELAKFAPAFGKVRAFGKRSGDEINVGNVQRQVREQLEADLKASRAEKERLRKRVEKLEGRVLRQRDIRILLAVISALVLALGIVLGILIGRGAV
ncbi:MAG: protein kinase [Planctomycetota bacterium]